MPEEVAFFGRTSLYGVVLAAVYWFVSYDVAGTALLGGFGLATGVGFLLLWRRHHVARREARASDARSRATDGESGAGDAVSLPTDAGSRTTEAESRADGLDPDRPFTDETGPVPLGSFAPLEVGFGIAVAALGLVFGIWFVLVASIPVVAGALTWVREARGEHDLVAARDRRTQLRTEWATPERAPTERASGDLNAR